MIQNGYKVMVKEESMKKTPAVIENSSFEEWSEVAKKDKIATRN